MGFVKNVRSFRYVNFNNFTYPIPAEIQDNPELIQLYNEHMDSTMNVYSQIQDYVLSKGRNKERANEQARYVLPIATNTSVTIGIDVEAAIHFCHKRLCNRAEDIIHQLAIKIRDAIIELVPELKPYLVAECEYLLWCPESKGCGRYPNKDIVKQILEDRTTTEKERKEGC